MANTTSTATREKDFAQFENPKAFAQLSTVQQANVVHHMYDEKKMNQKDIHAKVGVSVPQVSNLLTIYALPSKVKRLIEEDKLSGTLVLQIIRESKGKNDDEISDMILELYNVKKGKVTKKDFIEFQGKHNSFAETRNFMQRFSRNSIKKNEVAYGLLEAIVTGRFGEENLKRFFGITARN